MLSSFPGAEVNSVRGCEQHTITLVATHSYYDDAQSAVVGLSDARVPVEYVEIVGRDLRLGEHVTGRLTTTQETVAVAETGAGICLFSGPRVGHVTSGGMPRARAPKGLDFAPSGRNVEFTPSNGLNAEARLLSSRHLV